MKRRRAGATLLHAVLLVGSALAAVAPAAAAAVTGSPHQLEPAPPHAQPASPPASRPAAAAAAAASAAPDASAPAAPLVPFVRTREPHAAPARRAAPGQSAPPERRGEELSFNETGHHKTFMFAKSNTFIQLDGHEIAHFQLRLCRQISFEFRTRLPHGLLVYHSVKGRPPGMAPYALYIIVEKGQLKVLHVFGKHSTSLVLGEALNDDAWHSVEVRIDVHGRLLGAHVDGVKRESAISGLHPNANYGVEEELESVVLIGGLSPEEKLHGVKYIIESFVGCIKNIVLKTGKDSNSFFSIKPLIATKHENVIEGCKDKCLSRDNLCFVGSKCTNHYNSLTCDCFGTKYEGEQCDIYTATILTLRGSSYVSYRVYDWKDRVHSSQSRISFFFKTNFDDSALFYASGEPGKHYLAVSLFNDTIHVRLKIGENTINRTIGSDTAHNDWHNFTIAHNKSIIDIHFDNEKERIDLEGEDFYLYIDPEIHFGGGPELDKKEGLASTNNFVGSLKYVFFNDISILYELKKGNPKVHYIGVLPPEFKEENVEVIPLTFPFHSSYLFWNISDFPDTNNLSLSFDFKANFTLYPSAVLASSKVKSEESHEEGYWEISYKNDEIRFEVGPDNLREEIIVKYDGQKGWHVVDMQFLNGGLTITVDYHHRAMKKFDEKLIFTGMLMLAIGTGSTKTGLIGCMRDIKINGQLYDPRVLVNSNHAVKELSLDNCELVDPCKRPNTCEHGGKCSVQDDQVVCDCSKTEYIGKNCHFSQYRKTCEELALLGYTKPDIYLIDIDGNGPFPPAHVKCEFQSLEDSTKTIVEHNLESQTDVRRKDLGDHSLEIEYREFSADMLQELISHSLYCNQKIKYECSDAPLELHSATWFISSYKNETVDFIGNVRRGACPCSENRSCANPSQSCNCDGLHGKWLIDGGEYRTPQSLGIVKMVFLQQKDLKKDAVGRITLGPLECVEANTQKYVVTFTSSQSYIEVPGWRKGDISFSFRTTGEQAILLYQPPIREHHPSFLVALTSDYQLTFRFTLSTGEKQTLLVDSKRRLNSGEWQKIWIDYNEHHVRFMINTDSEFLDLNGTQKFGPFEGSMFIGGATEDLLKDISVKQGLIGCFRGLVVNGEILDIYSYMSVHLSEIIKDCKPSCDPNRCVNGAKCKELWSTFQCVCANPWAHEGEFCERNINDNGLTFLTESSYLSIGENLKGTVDNVLGDNILINVRTYKQNALVFYANDHLNNFVHLFVKDGQFVIFLFNSGSEIVNITIEYPGFDNGTAVQIAIIRKPGETFMDVNGHNNSVKAVNAKLTEYSNKPWSTSDLEVLGPHRPPTAPMEYYQFLLGGYSSDQLLMYSTGAPQPGFVGCIRGLKIGNNTVDLNALIPNTEGSGIKSDCNMICDAEPCGNQGVCIEDLENAKSSCECEHTSYYGETCTEDNGAEFQGLSVIQRKFVTEETFEEVKVQLAFSSSNRIDKKSLLLLLREPRGKYSLHIALANNGKELEFLEERGATLHTATIENVDFLDGHRHSVYYHRLKETAELRIDREHRTVLAKKVVPEEDSGMQDANGINLGGLSSAIPHYASYRGFSGCISNVFITVNDKDIHPIEEYFKGGGEVNVFNQSGIKSDKCAAFGAGVEVSTDPSLNNSLGREKKWLHPKPARKPYKSSYSDSTVKEAGSSTIIFLVMASLFVVIVVCALCEVYRTHRKHKRQLEREAEAAIMWPKSQVPPKLTPSIKLQGFKPVSSQEKVKTPYNGSDQKPITKNDYKQVPTSPPPGEQTSAPADRKQSNGKTQEQELEWDPMPDNTELILDKSLEDLANNKDEDENEIPKKSDQAPNPDGSKSKLGLTSQAIFPPIPEDEPSKRDSLTSSIETKAVKPTALVPGASLSPVFLSEEQRTFGNPISYLGGPHIDARNAPRASMESVLSVD